MRLLYIFIVLLVSSCTNSSITSTPSISTATLVPKPALPTLPDSYFGEPMEIVSVEDVFELSELQKSDFFEKFDSINYKHLKPNRRIFKYLQGYLKNFNYYSDTYTANETLYSASGNCLSLAILTNALAKLTNVKIKYELVATPPIYQKEGDLILGSQHIRTILYDPEPGDFKEAINWWRKTIKIDYFSTWGTHALRNVKSNEFYSMYYRNKAAEALIANNSREAYWYLKSALSNYKDDAQAINMMALLHTRVGYPEHAEKLYQYGLKYGTDKLELLINYRILLKKQKRYTEVAKLDLKLAQYDDPDPYKWMSLGNKAFSKKDYKKAIAFYRKANKQADYLHEPYVGMARAYYFLGNISKAKKLMEQALEYTYRSETKSIYSEKHRLLSDLLNKD